MEKIMKIASAQYPISEFKSYKDWEAHIAKWVSEAVQNQAKVLVFPEYGAMELVSTAEDSIKRDLKSQVRFMTEFKCDFLTTFKNLAAKHNICILAPSLPLLENKKYINRSYFFKPTGEFEFQDKQMMTRFEDEEWGVESGEHVLTVIETEYGKIGISICFDIEFPQFSKELCARGVQVLLAPSCTETMKGLHRVHVGARARALENQCYVVVSQTVGDAPWSLCVDKNQGIAAVFGPPDLGFPEDGIVVQGELNKPGWVYSDIDLKKVEEVRSKGAVFNYKHFHKK